MTTYSFTLSDVQEQLLSFVVRTANEQKDTSYTNQQYVQIRVFELLAPFTEAFKRATLEALESGYSKASPDVQQQVKELLKVS